MSLIALASRVVERAPLPDLVARAAIGRLVARTRRRLGADPQLEAAFAEAMDQRPIAEFTAAANRQHYELPAEFFGLVLGPRRKYSCCLYEPGAVGLAAAEERALAITADHADLANGQDILELGCGWGSLTLWMAEHYPASRITAVSNSRPQRDHIEGEARQRGLSNVRVTTADMNDFAPEGQFDRIVSVEMFEHMANWRRLLGRLRGWLKTDGRVFVHVFSHRSTPYRFDHADPADWIAQHFFTGGIMPSHGLMGKFPTLFSVEQEWRWGGDHYRRTAVDWLANYDKRRADIRPILQQTYGAQAALWQRRWRLFFLATAGLFGDLDGSEWGISHYRLRAAE